MAQITQDEFYDFIKKANKNKNPLYKNTPTGFKKTNNIKTSKDSINIDGEDVDMRHKDYETYDDRNYEGVKYRAKGFYQYCPQGIIATKKLNKAVLEDIEKEENAMNNSWESIGPLFDKLHEEQNKKGETK